MTEIRCFAAIPVRIKNLVNDFHRKISGLIVRNYKVIFLPTYESSQMVSHCGGRPSPA
jgi:putative transposase